MSAITVAVNDKRMATIRLPGLEMVDVHIHGGLDSEQKALLETFGGNDGAGGCGHLIWIEGHALLAGDVVTVGWTEAPDTADRGRTMDELYPDWRADPRPDYSIDAALAAELRARPRLHDAFKVMVDTSSMHHAVAASDARHTDFAFHVLWHSAFPAQARVRLATHGLDDVLARTGGTAHLQTTLAYGDSATFVCF